MTQPATQLIETPASVPGGAQYQQLAYGRIWDALQLGPESDLSDRLHHAQPRIPGREIAAEVLRQRPDVFDPIVDTLP